MELSNGCICCTMRGDLLREVTRLARGGAFDYLLIESTGVSEPMQVYCPPASSPDHCPYLRLPVVAPDAAAHGLKHVWGCQHRVPGIGSLESSRHAS